MIESVVLILIGALVMLIVTMFSTYIRLEKEYHENELRTLLEFVKDERTANNQALGGMAEAILQILQGVNVELKILKERGEDKEKIMARGIGFAGWNKNE